jgi:hypothetical protein
MTESEWLACKDPTTMLEFLRARVNDRKLRLWACTCAIQQNGRFEVIRRAVAEAEEWADGVRPVSQSHTSLTYVCNESAWVAAYEGTAKDLKRLLGTDSPEVADYRLALRYQLLALRDIFNNPFRPVTFSPDWRTDTAVSLARTMYDARDFSAMPILADALQDAGCDNDDILSHCRDANTNHVRGCWVIDLVLGKA